MFMTAAIAGDSNQGKQQQIRIIFNIVASDFSGFITIKDLIHLKSDTLITRKVLFMMNNQFFSRKFYLGN